MKSICHYVLYLWVAIGCLEVMSAPLTVSSYSYNNAPSGFYPDTGGTELTDGTTDTVVWPDTLNPSFDIGPLVGWQTVNGDITFNFSTLVELNSVTLWFADSDGSAGVDIPATFTLSQSGVGSSTVGTFALANPAGNGTTVPIMTGGLSTIDNSFRIVLDSNNGVEWNMLSEVQFDGMVIPEPSTMGLMGVVGLMFFTCRRSLKRLFAE